MTEKEIQVQYNTIKENENELKRIKEKSNSLSNSINDERRKLFISLFNDDEVFIDFRNDPILYIEHHLHGMICNFHMRVITAIKRDYSMTVMEYEGKRKNPFSFPSVDLMSADSYDALFKHILHIKSDFNDFSEHEKEYIRNSYIYKTVL